MIQVGNLRTDTYRERSLISELNVLRGMEHFGCKGEWKETREVSRR